MDLEYPIVLDGGLSNVLEANGCDLNHKLWSAKLIESDPESIVKAHVQYLESGAQIITTSTYQATTDGFMSLGLTKNEAQNLILKSIDLAEIAIQIFAQNNELVKKPLIAASIGPYGAFLADGSEYRGDYDISEEGLKQFHFNRLKILDESGADFFACETIPSFTEAKVLAEILLQLKKPSWISFSCKDELHINDGTRIDVCASLFKNHPKVFAVGVNCTNPEFIPGLIAAIKNVKTDKKIVVYPNSGQVYDSISKTWTGTSDPQSYSKMAKDWITLGADIVGGCCTIGPAHIKNLADYVGPK